MTSDQQPQASETDEPDLMSLREWAKWNAAQMAIAMEVCSDSSPSEFEELGRARAEIKRLRTLIAAKDKALRKVIGGCTSLGRAVSIAQAALELGKEAAE